MDGFLHLSRIGESFGMVLCEAMLCGVPVVTLSTPLKDNSQLEVVGHGIGGLVALTPRAVPEAMLALIADAGLRARVRAGGAAWVEERFGVGRVAGEAMAIYEAVLAGRPGSRGRVPDPGWIEAIAGRGFGRRPGMAERACLAAAACAAVYRAISRWRGAGWRDPGAALGGGAEARAGSPRSRRSISSCRWRRCR